MNISDYDADNCDHFLEKFCRLEINRVFAQTEKYCLLGKTDHAEDEGSLKNNTCSGSSWKKQWSSYCAYSHYRSWYRCFCGSIMEMEGKKLEV